MMKKIFMCALLFAGLFARVGFAEDKAKAGEPAKKSPVVPVSVINVDKQTAVFTQELAGRVSAYRIAQVRARVNGIVEKRVFTEGQDVAENDVLFKIEDKTLKANVSAAKADLDSANAAYALAKVTSERYRKLLKQNAVSKQEFDTYDAQTKQAAAKVEQTQAALDQAQINLDYATVVAPISGRIGRALVTEGALASAGATQLANIEQIDKVYVDFTRSYNDYMRLKNSMKSEGVENSDSNKVEILLDNDAPYLQKGELSFSDSSVDETTGSISLRAIVENPDRILLPGMYVRVKVPIAKLDNVFEVPQSAVTVDPMRGPIVYKVTDGKLDATPVTLGKMAGNNWVIEKGIKVGDKVVYSNLPLGTQPGVAVKITSEKTVEK